MARRKNYRQERNLREKRKADKREAKALRAKARRGDTEEPQEAAEEATETQPSEAPSS